MELKPKRYWRRWRRGYEKLDGSSSETQPGRKKTKRVKMNPARKKRFWRRIKIVPKLKILKTTSPKKLLVWIRDAYVKMMMRLANSRVVGASGYGDGSGFGSGQVKEYDEKMLVEIYKSILMARAQGNLVHRDVADNNINSKLGTSEPVVVSTVVR